MNKSAKTLLSIAVLSIIFMLNNIVTSALELRPDKIEYSADIIEVEIFSSYEGQVDGISIRFEVQNGIILDYIPEQGQLLNIGTCVDDKMFTETEVCVDSVNPDGIMSGDKLGTLAISISTDESVLLIPNGTIYINQTLGKKTTVEGILGVYTKDVATIDPGSTLNTIEEIIIEDDVDVVNDNSADTVDTVSPPNYQISGNVFIILSIIIFIGVGVGIVLILKSNKLGKKV